MKKKVIYIIIAICIFIACICLGIILVNISKENTNLSDIKSENETKNSEDMNINKDENQDNILKKEKVALDSRIGNKVLSKILIPNIYSKLMYNELDKNGVSNDFKIMFTYSLISTYQDYSNYLREGENYIGNYITKDDLEKVSSMFFYNTNALSHHFIFGDNVTYNNQTENYVVVARGYAGSNLEFIVEIPFEIYEYDNKVKVNSYRLYINRIYDMNEENSLPEYKVYYDSLMTNLATSIKDEKMNDEIVGQQDILQYSIVSGVINKELLEKSEWTLGKSGDNYLIEEYNKI